ncbi:MAG TPA: ATP-binding protein [Solirubrobacteraceae bacterium]|nr:ATP-binding protein [Solirubrobacteraceae bacterium]
MLCLSVDIPCDLRAPARGRHAVESLSRDVAPDVLADAKLLVSELITNSVKYGRSEVVRLELDSDVDGRLRVEVVDEGGGFVPTARDRPLNEVGGWGLHLVNKLADRWGVAAEASHVWFEIAGGASRAKSVAA